MTNHSTSQNATTSSQTMLPGSITPILRAVTVHAHQPTGSEQPITQAHATSLIQGAISINAAQAHRVPEVPGAMRERPEPRPSAMAWAGCDSMKRSVGRATGAGRPGSCGKTVTGAVLASYMVWMAWVN